MPSFLTYLAIDPPEDLPIGPERGRARGVAAMARKRARHIAAMKTHKAAILIERLDERRYAITVDGIVRYVGTQEECQQRAAVLTQKKDRPDQDKALARSVRLIR